MSGEFYVGVVVGLVASAGVWIGIGYERARLALASRTPKPAPVVPDKVVPST